MWSCVNGRELIKQIVLFVTICQALLFALVSACHERMLEGPQNLIYENYFQIEYENAIKLSITLTFICITTKDSPQAKRLLWLLLAFGELLPAP